jgi:hypothetical protein
MVNHMLDGTKKNYLTNITQNARHSHGDLGLRRLRLGRADGGPGDDLGGLEI